MKCILLQALLGLSTGLASGQGTVIFNNRVAGTVVTHVWYGCPQIHGNSPIDTPPGATSYDGLVLTGAPGGPSAVTTFASLLGGPGANAAPSSMQSGVLTTGGASATTFRTGGAAGNIVASTATFANIPADAPVATFQMVAWDNSSGLYPSWAQASIAWSGGLIGAGFSDTFVVTNIGGFSNSPPFLTGLTSFAWGVLECPALVAQQPFDQAAVVGGRASFAVVGRTWTGQTNYQWYFNNSRLGGATNASLSLSNVQPPNFGSYYVTVSDGQLAYQATSTLAHLTFALKPSLAISRSGGTSQLSFRTETGPSYEVDFKNTLTDAAWMQLTTNAGTGGFITVTDGAGGVASRFYRVRVL